MADLSLVITRIFETLLKIRGLNEGVKGHSLRCHDLIERCADFEDSLKQTHLHSVKVSVLKNLSICLEACYEYCEKYSGKIWINKVIIAALKLEKFTELEERLCNAVEALNLDLTVKRIEDNLDHNRKMQEADKAAIETGIFDLMKVHAVQPKGLTADELKMLLKSIAQEGIELRLVATSSDTHTLTMSSESLNSDVDSTCLDSANAASVLDDLDLSALVWSERDSELLGQGGFGKVYLGQYKGVSRAVKVLSFPDDPGKEEVKKARREARVAALLRHENVIQYFGCCLREKVLVFELASCSLHDLVYEKKKCVLPSGEALTVGNLQCVRDLRCVLQLWRDVAHGLLFLHHYEVIHRDIKPSNILVVPSRSPDPVQRVSGAQQEEALCFTAKIADFGLASCQTFSQSSIGSKGGKGAVGTDSYLAPELLDGEDLKVPYSCASDMYALGITMNELMTRKIPFEGLRPNLLYSRVVVKQLRPDPFQIQIQIQTPSQASQDGVSSCVSLSDTHVSGGTQIYDAQEACIGLVGNSGLGLLHQDPMMRPDSRSVFDRLSTVWAALADATLAVDALTPVGEAGHDVGSSVSQIQTSDRPLDLEQILNGVADTETDQDETTVDQIAPEITATVESHPNPSSASADVAPDQVFYHPGEIIHVSNPVQGSTISDEKWSCCQQNINIRNFTDLNNIQSGCTAGFVTKEGLATACELTLKSKSNYSYICALCVVQMHMHMYKQRPQEKEEEEKGSIARLAMRRLSSLGLQQYSDGVFVCGVNVDDFAVLDSFAHSGAQSILSLLLALTQTPTLENAVELRMEALKALYPLFSSAKYRSWLFDAGMMKAVVSLLRLEDRGRNSVSAADRSLLLSALHLFSLSATLCRGMRSDTTLKDVLLATVRAADDPHQQARGQEERKLAASASILLRVLEGEEASTADIEEDIYEDHSQLMLMSGSLHEAQGSVVPGKTMSESQTEKVELRVIDGYEIEIFNDF